MLITSKYQSFLDGNTGGKSVASCKCFSLEEFDLFTKRETRLFFALSFDDFLTQIAFIKKIS